MRRTSHTLAALASGLAVALAPAVALGQSSANATRYCTPGGGPLGAATDAEHTVAVGDPPVPRGVRVSRVKVGGVSTRVLQSGPRGARDAVVFIHGSPDSARDWDDLLPRTGRFARSVALDIPGYGKSDKVAPKLQTTDGAAAYVQGVMEKLGVRRAVLVLHDFGGPWGLQWAVAHKPAFLGTVLLDTGVLIDYLPHPLSVVWSEPIAGELQMASTTRQSFVASLQASQPRPLPNAFLQRLYDDYDRSERCAILRYYRSAAKTFSTLGRSQAAALRPLDRPALVLWGAGDIFVPKDQAQKQRQAFPHARIHVLDNAGHWIQIDSPDRVRALALPFLRPRLRVGSPRRVRAGARRVRIRVHVRGMLPAYRVRARVVRAGRARTRAASRTAAEVSGTRTLAARARRPLGRGRYRVIVRARGLPRVVRKLRVVGSHGRR